MKTEREYRAEICEVGRRVWKKGWVAANDGNISVKLSEREYLCTPTGVSKGFLTPDMLIVVNADGERIRGTLKPSSEVPMHIEAYKARPDITAVVHAHPATATGYAVAGIPLTQCVLPEVIIGLGGVPLAPYGTPSTMELADAAVQYLTKCDAVLLANHGVITVGPELMKAYYKMESVELFAQISLTAHMLGQQNVLSNSQVEGLMRVRDELGVKGPNIGCETCQACSVTTPSRPPSRPTGTQMNEDELVRLVAEVTREVLAEQNKR